MRLKLICLVLVGLLVVVATGCGSKKKKSTTATTPMTTAITGATGTTGATGGLNLSSTDCANLAAASSTVSKAFGGTVPKDLSAQVARLQALAKVAPAEIKGDFETLLSAASQVARIGLQPGKVPTAKQLQALQSLPIAKLSQAATNIGTWAAKHCTTG